ncbi:MAG: OmpH family outer membrane protein [Solirubrobacteraceae bacterium]
MKKLFLISSLLLVNYGYSQKVAFINEQKILNAIPNYENNLKETKVMEEKMINELKQANTLIEEKTNKLLTKNSLNNVKDLKYEELMSKLSKTDKAVLEEIKKENELLQQKIKDKQTEYQAFFKEKLGKDIEKVNVIVKNYCGKNKIDLLLKVDALEKGIAFYEAKKDVSEEIIAAVKK